MKRLLHTTAMMALLASAAALRPIAAQDGDLTIEVGECAELTSPETRLACFDGRVDAARQERSLGSSAPSADSVRPSSREAERPATFEADRARSRREERESAEALDIVAKVVELRETVPNAYLITLDNGQIWRQTRPMNYPLRQGAEVRIYSSRWGERLTDPQLSGFIQVDRVR